MAQAFYKFAAVGIGALLGQWGGVAVLATVSLPLGEAVEALFHGLDGAKRARAKSLCHACADALYVLGRGCDPGTLEAARLQCETLLDRFGLDDAAFVAVALDPERAADRVLFHARFTNDERAEIAPWSKRLLTCFYDSVRRNHELLADLLPSTYAALLVADQRIEAKVDEALALLRASYEGQIAELKQYQAQDRDVIAAQATALRALAERAERPGAPPEAERALDAAIEGDLQPGADYFRTLLARKKQQFSQLQGGADAARTEAAEAARNLGALLFQNDTVGALAAYREAAELDPDDAWTWIFISRLEARAGRLTEAASAAERAQAAAEATGLDRDLIVADNELGDLRMAQGNSAPAVTAYRRALEVARKLAAADPANTEWQRDLSVSLIKIGDVLRAQGDGAGALKSYRDSLAIAEKLAAADPANTEWQRDLIVSNVKLAQISGKDAAVTRRYYEAALAIATTLESTGRLAPVDAWIPDDLRKRLTGLPN